MPDHDIDIKTGKALESKKAHLKHTKIHALLKKKLKQKLSWFKYPFKFNKILIPLNSHLNIS